MSVQHDNTVTELNSNDYRKSESSFMALTTNMLMLHSLFSDTVIFFPEISTCDRQLQTLQIND